MTRAEVRHGDCLDILPTLEAGSVDAVVMATMLCFAMHIWYTGNLHPSVVGITMIEISDLQCGKAGEHLVCADLILAGYVAFTSEQGLPYDIVVEIGNQLVRVQVKTTRTVRTVPQRKTHCSGYLFHVKRRGKDGLKTYIPGMIDLFAMVALDSREIGYLAPADTKQTMLFRSPLLEGKYRDEQTTARDARIVALREEGKSFRVIAKEVGVDPTFAQRVCVGKSSIRQTNRYLRDYSFSEALRRIGIDH